MYKLKLKPLTVNRAYKGRRRRTELYNQFRRLMFALLSTMRPRPKPPPDEPLFAVYRCGQSNFLLADVDNPVKLIQDVFFEWARCKERDKRVQFLIAVKVPVPKKEEFIEIHVDTYDKLVPYLEGMIEDLKREKDVGELERRQKE